MKLSELSSLDLPVRWIETNHGPLRVASLADMPVVDYNWLLSLDGPAQQVEADFEYNTIKLIVKPGAGKPLTVDELAKLVRERAKFLREQRQAV